MQEGEPVPQSPAHPAAAPRALVLRDVRRSFGGGFTLGPVDLRFEPGVTALLGANGAGKTTLMRLAVGILAPDGGQVLLGGAAARGVDVGYLPQDFSGPRNVRVKDYLRFIAWCRSRRGRRLDDRDVHAALASVNLADATNARIGALSGGMLRRVGIAQALLGRTGVLVLDEPTVGLDPLQRRELRSLLVDLGGTSTIVLSTHLSEDVAAVAERVAVLHEGSVVYSGAVSGLTALGEGPGHGGEAVEAGFLRAIGGTPDA